MASNILRFFQGLLDAFNPTPPEEGESRAEDPPSDPNAYYPSSPRDVYHAAWVLQHFLPWELVVYTMDLAEYWPRLMAENDQIDRITQDSSPFVSVKLPIETFNTARPVPVRKIIIDVWGHDQGWCSSPDRGSWTWYDLQLLKPGEGDEKPPEPKAEEKPPEPEKEESDADGKKTKWAPTQSAGVQDDEPEHSPLTHRLATNIQANRATQHHHFEWFPEEAKEEPLQGECPADIMRELGQGSTLQVRAHARYGGWINHVEGVHIAAFIAVVH